MNADKWARSASVGRLVEHLAAVGPVSRVAGVLADLAGALDGGPRVADARERLRAWAEGGQALRLEDAWDLDRAAEADGDPDAWLAGQLVAAVTHPAAVRGDGSHARRAAEALVDALARALDVPRADADALLADRVRERLPSPP